jgi:hypothetical protein
MDAIGPYWNTIHTFDVDSRSLFMAPCPPKFDTIANSDFYKMAKLTYETTLKLTDDILLVDNNYAPEI